MGTGDGLVGGVGKGVGLVSKEMIPGDGVGEELTRGLGLTRGGGLMLRGLGLALGLGLGVGLAAWEVPALAKIANVKVAKPIVIVFVNLMGILSWMGGTDLF